MLMTRVRYPNSASLKPVAEARLVLPTPPLPLNNRILIHRLYAKSGKQTRDRGCILGLVGRRIGSTKTWSLHSSSDSTRSPDSKGVKKVQTLMAWLAQGLREDLAGHSTWAPFLG